MANVLVDYNPTNGEIRFTTWKNNITVVPGCENTQLVGDCELGEYPAYVDISVNPHVIKYAADPSTTVGRIAEAVKELTTRTDAAETNISNLTTYVGTPSDEGYASVSLTERITDVEDGLTEIADATSV